MAPVEAASLSDLNLLAANPPLYPYNPADEPRPPLTLYLSRVPGTKDIILSPLKPHGKNVTVADVASALYYVHLDGPGDAAAAAAAAAAAGTGSGSGAPAARIARKPLSPTAGTEGAPVPAPAPAPAPARKPVPPAEPEAPPKPPRPTFRTLLSRDREAAGAPPLPTTTTTAGGGAVQPPPPETPHVVIQRKPLSTRGPRPVPPADSHRTDDNNDADANDDDDDDVPPPLPRRDPARLSAILPPLTITHAHPLPPIPTGPDSHGGLDASSVPPHPHPDTTTTAPPPAPGIPFQLTLIRRDPATDHQWNIGKIASEQAADPGDAAAAAAHPVIHVRIDTSGYAKFQGRPSRQSVAAVAHALSPTSLKQTVEAAAAAAGLGGKEEGVAGVDAVAAALARDAAAGTGSGPGFSRDLVMAYRRRWTAGLRQALRRGVATAAAHGRARSESGGGGGGGLGMGMGMHRHSGSTVSVSEGEAGEADRPAPPKAQGYVFLSPWDSACAFRASRGGQRLTCRHALQPGAAPGRASLRAVMTGTARVSELRFSLPDRPDDEDDDHENDSDHSDSDQDAVLQLGREAAGGGSRGTRAKLGKLLVFDDGFKMLDLVVAANMGVWWVAWEQGF